MYYEPAEKMLRRKMSGASELYLNFAPLLFERLRKESGAEVHLLHDAHHRLTTDRSSAPGEESRTISLFWLEIQFRRSSGKLRWIRQHTTTPLAVGEGFDTIYDCQQLIQDNLLITFRTTVVHAGGISHCERSPVCRSLSCQDRIAWREPI